MTLRFKKQNSTFPEGHQAYPSPSSHPFFQPSSLLLPSPSSLMPLFLSFLSLHSSILLISSPSLPSMLSFPLHLLYLFPSLLSWGFPVLSLPSLLSSLFPSPPILPPLAAGSWELASQPTFPICQLIQRAPCHWRKMKAVLDFIFGCISVDEAAKEFGVVEAVVLNHLELPCTIGCAEALALGKTRAASPILLAGRPSLPSFPQAPLREAPEKSFIRRVPAMLPLGIYANTQM